MMGWYNNGDMGFWMLLMPLIWIAVVGVAAWVVVALTRSSGKSDGNHTESPDEVLQRRLAEGHITSEEYVHTRDLLHGRQ